MIINNNGSLISLEQINFSFSDSLLSSSAMIEERILFSGLECAAFEEHYFSIMASMRIFRRSIPMGYTPEFLLEEIQKTLKANAALSKTLVFFYSGLDALTHPVFYITVKPLKPDHFRAQIVEEIDVFKDFYWHSDYLSGIRVKPLPVQVVADAYCTDHAHTDCVLVNERKEIVMSLNGFIFLRFGNTLKTPAENSGVYRDVFRTRLIEQIKTMDSFDFEQCALNPFDVQRADEFVVISLEKGLFAVNNYRKTTYQKEWIYAVEQRLNELI
ncbi:MAG: aminotransferase class IV [Flavobacteriaceae bacterium]